MCPRRTLGTGTREGLWPASRCLPCRVFLELVALGMSGFTHVVRLDTVVPGGPHVDQGFESHACCSPATGPSCLTLFASHGLPFLSWLPGLGRACPAR